VCLHMSSGCFNLQLARETASSTCCRMVRELHALLLCFCAWLHCTNCSNDYWSPHWSKANIAHSWLIRTCTEHTYRTTVSQIPGLHNWFNPHATHSTSC
jgi:hypothetical protein